MIKIKHKNLNNIAKTHFDNIKKYFEDKRTKYSLEETNAELLKATGFDFETIVTCRPDKLRESIRFALDKNIYKDKEHIKKLREFYPTMRNKWGTQLVKNLDLTVCPYCNREYIFLFEDSKKSEARILASLDHFYDKDTYPFLSVSFFNLIPSCSICNSKFKHTKNFYKEIHLHPYEDDFNTLAKFDLIYKEGDFYFDKNKINLKIKIETSDKYEETNRTIETFRLSDLYNEHKDIVIEMINKKYVYSDDYIDSLLKQYEGTLFKNKEELMSLLLGNYLKEEDFHKRPLSKLTHDIAEELGLI